MTNFTKTKKGHFRPKKQAGAELKKKKKEFFGSKIGGKIGNNVQKLTDFKEKKDFSGQKKQAGAELGKIVGEKIEYKGQKLNNFQKKKGIFRPKKQAGLSLRRKKRIFWIQNL